MPRLRFLLLAALAAASCDDVRTASGDHGLNFSDFPSLPGAPPFLALAGTRLCEEDTSCRDCEVCEDFVVSVAGAEPDAAGCHTVEPGAPLTYTFTPQACTPAPPTESLVIEAVALAQVSARFDPPITTADAASPPDFPTLVQGAPAPDRGLFTPLQLLAATEVGVPVELVEPGSARVVGWNPSKGALALQAITGPLPAVSDALPGVTLRAAAGSRASATLTLEGVELPLAEVLGVGPEAVHDLEISAFFFDGGADGQYPVQVEAHALDVDGKPILGVPIEWRVIAGDLVLDLGEDEHDTTHATAGLLECIPQRPRGTRSGTIEASHGELVATLEVTWKGYTGPDAMNAGLCTEGAGCGCRSTAPGDRAWLALGLALFALRRRRRSVR